MKKRILLLIGMAFLLVSCSSGLVGGTAGTSQPILSTSTSHFIRYTAESTDAAHTIQGTVSQENDGNAILVYIRAEKDAEVRVTGTVKQVSGGDTQLVYLAPDGTKTEIAVPSAGTIDGTIPVLAGEGAVKFLGESAVYDFEIAFDRVEGISYSDL